MMSSVSKTDLIPVWMSVDMAEQLIKLIAVYAPTNDVDNMVAVFRNAIDNPQTPTVDLATEPEA
jgi:hypothetical protein